MEVWEDCSPKVEEEAKGLEREQKEIMSEKVRLVRRSKRLGSFVVKRVVLYYIFRLTSNDTYVEM